MSKKIVLAAVALSVACTDAPTRSGATDPSAALDLTASEAGAIRLTYMCGNRFRVRNPNPDTATVTWDVYRTQERGTLLLSAKPETAPHSETFFTTANKGTVRLFYKNTLIQTKANGNTVCAATPRELLTVVGEGVQANLTGGISTHTEGSSVSYSFSLAPGYDSLEVYVDSLPVSATGAITMSADRFLVATAVKTLIIEPGSEGLYTAFRDVFESTDPVAAYTGYLDAIDAAARNFGDAELSRRLDIVTALAFNWPRDSVALARVDAALANHVFERTIGGFARSAARWKPRTSAGTFRQLAAAGDSAEPAVYAYINGILTSRADHLLSLRVSGASVLPALGTPYWGAHSVLRGFYNRTGVETIIPTTPAERLYRCSVLYGYLAKIGGDAYHRAVTRCVAQPVTGSAIDDFLEVARQIPSVTMSLPWVEADSRAFADSIASWRANEGRHVIVIAHSQGNLMTRQALQVLEDDGRWQRQSDSTGIGMVSIAPPILQTTWNLDTLHRKTIITRGDIVADPAWSDLAIPDGAIETQLSQDLRQSLDSVYPITKRINPLITSRYFVAKLKAQVTLHGVITSYLLEGTQRIRTEGALRTLYREMTVGAIESLLEGETRYVGQGRNLGTYLTVLSRNGRQLFGRVLEYSSSDAAVASVSPTGRVTCVAPGSAVISARSWQVVRGISYTCLEVPIRLSGTWVGTFVDREGPVPVRVGSASFSLAQSGNDVSGTVTWLGYTMMVSGTVFSDEVSTSGELRGRDGECDAYFLANFGVANHPGCVFRLLVGVSAGNPGRLTAIEFAPNASDKDFTLTKQP